MGSRLLIRADASQRIGSGHVMRCLALAQAWQKRGGQVCLASRSLPEKLKSRWREEGVETRQIAESGDDAGQTVSLARETGADWVVLDGYQFGKEFQQTIKEAGNRLLVVDDDGCARQYVADLILNQNPCASPDMYASCNSGTSLLLGARYALLRREFLRAHAASRTHQSHANRVLITLGGADPNNCTALIIEALAAIEELEVIAVVGPNNPRATELDALARHGHGRIAIQQNPPNIPELMAWAELAISAAGTTCWEMAFMGLPMLLVVLADNQRLNARCVSELGVAGNLGWWSELSGGDVRSEVMRTLGDPALCASMARRGLALVDGRGANRVVTEMRSRLSCFGE